MINDMIADEYSMGEHIHRYACWTAARAASISRFSNNEISRFILENNLQNELDKIKNKEITSDEYKEWFVKRVDGILSSMKNYTSNKEEKPFRKISFGIAAKVISIYEKYQR